MLVDEEVASVICPRCVQVIQIKKYGMPDIYKKTKKSSGRPPGWQWMKDFVDLNGDVYNTGKIFKKGTKRVPTVKTTEYKNKKKARLTKKTKQRRFDSELLISAKIVELKKEVNKLKNKKAIKKRMKEITRLEKKLLTIKK